MRQNSLPRGSPQTLGRVQSIPTGISEPRAFAFWELAEESQRSTGPTMRQMARYMQHYPLKELVTHRFGLRDVDAAVKKSVARDSTEVVIESWV